MNTNDVAVTCWHDSLWLHEACSPIVSSSLCLLYLLIRVSLSLKHCQDCSGQAGSRSIPKSDQFFLFLSSVYQSSFITNMLTDKSDKKTGDFGATWPETCELQGFRVWWPQGSVQNDTSYTSPCRFVLDKIFLGKNELLIFFDDLDLWPSYSKVQSAGAADVGQSQQKPGPSVRHCGF